ncbi:hypothetical protein KBD61_01030 [Patescibacteria group bacterium]|nr:hypothetical protein [Patescibacteria group bacterium]MBP9709592.1 hypothetical protein [Patescibacteria group bacterium]
MPTPLILTVTEIQSDHVIATTNDGQRLSLPITAILGKAQLNQPIFLLAAATGNESGLQHPLAQTVIQHLLEPLT